ncbi:uncharacterized protein LOC129588794 isoform X2 [Paramacrobiotus metropolitanus]|uniref:uncharacterized protein LOC129588794 isoform X2 n=1 Tax=Paramacrobiotus metropolitanus TaxID=2943436 RepID=UPI0024464237|nr:uncharacterized protein LOC129588794 isoform X2 [Paramacrobiotus metropolitanus]
MRTIYYVAFHLLVAAGFLSPAAAIVDDPDVEITEDQSERQMVLKTLRTMERLTKGCILFKPRTYETDYLHIQGSGYGRCTADLGRTGYLQDIYLGSPSNVSPYSSTCFNPGEIMAALMRSLGFDYEHKRPDRDQYVEVRNDSIDSDYYYSVYRINPSMYTFGTRYDYQSIQHAFAWAYSLSRNPAMVSRIPVPNGMGRRKSLSPTDVAKIMIAYNCPFNVTRSKRFNTDDEFPKFSLEKMTEEECGAQFNRYCKSDITTMDNCTLRTDFRVVCRANASLPILTRMAVDMAEPPLRLVSMDVAEQLVARYSFAPLQRQVVKLQLRNCSTERVTARLIELNFTSLLDFQLYDARSLVIEKKDFATSKRLRIVVFYNTTLKTLQQGTFTDLPDLQILSLEALFEDQKYYNFDPSFRSFLRDLHCSCKFAWYRTWWQADKKLRIRVDAGDVYSFDARYIELLLESSEFNKEDLYHPVNCRAEPFPFGTEWINYYTQIDYSINEPPCNAPKVHGSNAITSTKVATVTKSPSSAKTTPPVTFLSASEPNPAENLA